MCLKPTQSMKILAALIISFVAGLGNGSREDPEHSESNEPQLSGNEIVVSKKKKRGRRGEKKSESAIETANRIYSEWLAVAGRLAT